MVFLVTTIVKTFYVVVNLASMAIFRSVAALLALAIHALKVPRFALTVFLEQAVGILGSAMGHIAELLLNFVFTVASMLVEVLLNCVSGAAGAIGSGAKGLFGMTNSAWKDITSITANLIKDLSGVVESISVVWNNFLEAIQYVKEKV